MQLDDLYSMAEVEKVDIREHRFTTSRIKGLYYNNTITLNPSALSSQQELKCILAEELGHHFTSYGNILDQSKLYNRKQERRARAWAYEKLVPLSGIVQAYQDGVRNRHELSEHLDVIEEFLDQALIYYREKYGLYAIEGRYIIYFNPLRIAEFFEF